MIITQTRNKLVRTLLAQKYYINNLESKVNHLENTVTLLQSTLEKSSSTQLSAPRNESVSERSDSCGATQFRQIENRLNSMESQLLNNLYMQNQMTLQNQINLQSLFHCQNQLITGLADRQQNG